MRWLTLALGVVAATGASGEPLRGPAPQTVAETAFDGAPGHRAAVWIEGLEAPWSLVFLPDGRALVSERPGRIRLIRDGRLADAPYAVFDPLGVGDGLLDRLVELAAGGEAGLMGLAVHPRFPEAPYVYAMHSYRTEGGIANRVVRLVDQGARARFDRVIVDGIPGGRVHDGGRIGFGPDGMLYVATGDAGAPATAAERASLAGKILRLAADGAVPADNPFAGSPVYSLGHRNPQGLAWHPATGVLFASEHGPTGEFGLGAHDEINVIRPGADYGWPRAVGAPGSPDFVDPIVAWIDRSTPPSGMAFWRGDLWVATLRSEALIRLRVVAAGTGYQVAGIERWFAAGSRDARLGRLRDAVAGPDGALYVVTNNRDGRGRPRAGDDKILRMTAQTP